MTNSIEVAEKTPVVPTTTLIVALLDRSGSMSTIKLATEAGFNAFIKDQLELSDKIHDDARLSLVQFDSIQRAESVYENMPLANVPRLTVNPRGSTPLNDALGLTINSTRQLIDRLEDKPDTVIFIVMTDGYENDSREYSKVQVKALVEKETENGWRFIFLGVGIDAFAEGASYGVQKTNTMKSSGNLDLAATYDSVSRNTTSYRSRNKK